MLQLQRFSWFCKQIYLKSQHKSTGFKMQTRKTNNKKGKQPIIFRNLFLWKFVIKR